MPPDERLNVRSADDGEKPCRSRLRVDHPHEIDVGTPNGESREAGPGGQRAANQAVQRVERSCRAVVGGRRAAQTLSRWCKRCGLSESEFHILWFLWRAAPGSLDQTTLANRLVLSPALVSATVERLRGDGRIARIDTARDRRRNLWRLTADGERLLEQMLAEADQYDETREAAGAPAAITVSRSEEAA